MKTILLSAFVLLSWCGVNGQELLAGLDKKTEKVVAVEREREEKDVYRWEFWSSLKQEEVRTGNRNNEAVFGKEVAGLLEAMNEGFLKREQIVAGDPQVQSTIRKPGIYNAVRNIERYYRQKSRQHTFTAEDADMFIHVVKVALASVDSEDSDNFEAVLQENRKSAEGQIRCFRQVKLNSLYE